MSWRAIYTEAGRELAVRDALRSAGVPSFCPLERHSYRKRARGGFWKMVSRVQAIFPGYVFASSDNIPMLVGVEGALRVVSSGGVPCCVPRSDVEALQTAADADGVISSNELSLLSIGFSGREGDTFRFVEQHSFLGGVMGRITSLARVLEHDEVEVSVQMMGAERPFTVPAFVIGEIVERGKAVPA